MSNQTQEREAIAARHRSNQCANLSSDGRSCRCANEMQAVGLPPREAPVTTAHSRPWQGGSVDAVHNSVDDMVGRIDRVLGYVHER